MKYYSKTRIPLHVTCLVHKCGIYDFCLTGKNGMDSLIWNYPAF